MTYKGTITINKEQTHTVSSDSFKANVGIYPRNRFELGLFAEEVEKTLNECIDWQLAEEMTGKYFKEELKRTRKKEVKHLAQDVMTK